MRSGTVLMLCLACSASEATAEDWHADRERYCLTPPYSAAVTAEQTRVFDAIERLKPLAEDLPLVLGSIAAFGPDICIDPVETAPRGYYDPALNLIALNIRLSPAEDAAILVHELRHMDRFMGGFCPPPGLSMREHARGVLATEADAMAIVALAGWTLKNRGDTEIWQAMLAWPNYADIPQRLSDELQSGASLEGAVAAAFEQWYASDWRQDSYYRAACTGYLDQQDETKALPSYDALPDAYFTDLCTLPDGRDYPCAE